MKRWVLKSNLSRNGVYIKQAHSTRNWIDWTHDILKAKRFEGAVDPYRYMEECNLNKDAFRVCEILIEEKEDPVKAYDRTMKGI